MTLMPTQRPTGRHRTVDSLLPTLLATILILGTTGCTCLRSRIHPTGESTAHRVNNRSLAFPVQEDDLSFLMNYTGYRYSDADRTEGETFFTSTMPDKMMSMLDQAEETIILSVFLLDNFYSKQTPQRDVVTPLVDKLIERKTAHPDMDIAVILDPSNKAYGQRLSPAEQRFREHGIDVFYSDLLAGLKKASFLGIREGLGHVNRGIDWMTFRTWGRAWSSLFSKARLPMKFDGDPVTLETAYNAFLLKANHRKLLVTDVGGETMEALITTANPHNPSANHVNNAITVRGEPARFIYHTLREDMLHSANLGPLYAHWHHAADKRYRKTFGETTFPRMPDPVAGTTGETGTPTVRFVSEREILYAVLELLKRVEPDDQVRIQMFYLSNRAIVDAVLDASTRTHHPVRLLLDANKDSFNREKDGTPNRQAARHLVQNARKKKGLIEVRWYSTHGEQMHAKTMSITSADGTRNALTTGSCNWTSRNIAGVNMEANVVVENSPNINQSFNTLFDLFWSNGDGNEYSLDYKCFEHDTAGNWKWKLGERPFYLSSF